MGQAPRPVEGVDARCCHHGWAQWHAWVTALAIVLYSSPKRAWRHPHCIHFAHGGNETWLMRGMTGIRLVEEGLKDDEDSNSFFFLFIVLSTMDHLQTNCNLCTQGRDRVLEWSWRIIEDHVGSSLYNCDSHWRILLFYYWDHSWTQCTLEYLVFMTWSCMIGKKGHIMITHYHRLFLTDHAWSLRITSDHSLSRWITMIRRDHQWSHVIIQLWVTDCTFCPISRNIRVGRKIYAHIYPRMLATWSILLSNSRRVRPLPGASWWPSTAPSSYMQSTGRHIRLCQKQCIDHGTGLTATIFKEPEERRKVLARVGMVIITQRLKKGWSKQALWQHQGRWTRCVSLRPVDIYICWPIH